MINGLWMDQIMRNPGSMATGKLELSPGQIVNGKVLQLLPERQAIFQIGGMKVFAQLESQLEVGERVWLQVQAASQPIQLKTVIRSEKGTGKNKLVTGSLSDLAKVLEFDSSPEHKELLSRLLHAKVALTKDTIPVMKSALKELGGDMEAVDTIVLAAKRGLPLSKEVLKGLKTFFYGHGLSELVHQLPREIVETLNHPQVSLIPEVRLKLELLLQQFEGMNKVDLSSADSIRENLLDMFGKMGFLDCKDITQRIPPLLQELKSLLSHIPIFNETSLKMEQLLRFANGQLALANPNENWFQQLIFQIPFHAFGNQSFLQLEAKKKESGEIDPEHCRLLFCLEMENLGDLILDVRIVNRIVSLEVKGSQQEKLKSMETFRDQLQLGLKHLGYHLSSIKIGEQTIKSKQGSNHMGLSVPYKGVDLRV